MTDKIFGEDFVNETNPNATSTVSVNNGTDLVDVQLQYLYKALGSPSIQALLDLLSSTRGSVLYRGSSGWDALIPGTAGKLLMTNGADTDPSWELPGNLAIASQAQGDILYFNGTSWVRLAAGTSGQFLKTLGTGANPAWDTPSGGGGGSNSIVDGRLTLATGVPVPTTDQTAKTTVYFTPYIGNKIALYDGVSTWNVRTFSEISVAVPSTTNTPFDIFCYDNAGTPTLETVNWTNDTTRATALTTQDGVLVKSGATTRRYLGTGRTTGVSGQCEDSVGGTHQSGGKRFLWNYYNRVRRTMRVIDTTDSWSYKTQTWRQANNATGNKVEFVIGVAEDAVNATLLATVSLNANSGHAAYVAVGVDATNSPSGIRQAGYNSAASTLIAPCSAAHDYVPAAGYHYLAWLEYGADGTTCNFFGDNGGVGLQAGLNASVLG